MNMYFLLFRIFVQLALALKTEFALKFFKIVGVASPPQPPASYAYACCSCERSTLFFTVSLHQCLSNWSTSNPRGQLDHPRSRLIATASNGVNEWPGINEYCWGLLEQ